MVYIFGVLGNVIFDFDNIIGPLPPFCNVLYILRECQKNKKNIRIFEVVMVVFSRRDLKSGATSNRTVSNHGSIFTLSDYQKKKKNVNKRNWLLYERISERCITKGSL